jgi:protein-S-isoprenylcysteine O-methyltransferase Ste14
MMGKRGEGWVVLQFLLFVIIALAPLREQFALPFLRAGAGATALRAIGVLLMAGGGLFGMAAVLGLGRNLTAFPRPIEGGTLVTSGAYAIVRHPIYAGLILAAFGWALWNTSLVGLGLGVILFLFFDLKSRQEERWLAQVYPEYRAYQQRVKKLIPWVY